jgi:EF-P beta-lysylation protein EpmB
MAIVTSSSDSVRAALPRWQDAVRTAIRDAAELCDRLHLPVALREAAVEAGRSFRLFVPQAFVAKMRLGDPADPLLRQVLPLADELADVAGYTRDPVGDRLASTAPGLLQKYSGRALLVTTGACAVHCRYCFRRHFPYSEAPHSLAQWQPALDQIASDPTVHEVILSGGDPLMLTDAQLAQLAEQIAAIPSVRRLRIHTRLPVMIPERVTPDLVRMLRDSRLTPLVVVHANHPRELDRDVADAIAALIQGGIPVLNQSVLLRGINDDLATLVELSERLVDLRVMPYYLHQMDRVAGAAHMTVPESTGRELVAQMRRHLPGFAVPLYVREEPSAPHKLPLG